MKAWITKYALTQGIYTVDGETSPSFPGMFIVKGKAGCCEDYYHGEGREWHLTEDAALARAEEIRLQEIARLEKGIEKLKGIAFDNSCTIYPGNA